MRSLIVALLAALLCAGVAAQDKIYKVRTADGKILFTDKPPPGSAIVSEREVPPPTPEPAAPAAKPEPRPGTGQGRPTQADARPRNRSAQVDEAFAAVQAAERELETARQQLEQGRAPREGEMLATARGGVRAGPAYQERVADLEKAVAAAEQKLAKAREGLDAVR
jgi:hypothetical protein